MLHGDESSARLVREDSALRGDDPDLLQDRLLDVDEPLAPRGELVRLAGELYLPHWRLPEGLSAAGGVRLLTLAEPAHTQVADARLAPLQRPHYGRESLLQVR